MRALIRAHPVFSFYLFAFAISWGSVLIVAGPHGFVSTTAGSPTFALVGFAALLGPGLAGIVMTGLVDGRAGFRELRTQLLRWRVGARWYAVALLIAPLLTLAVLVPLSLTSTAFVPAIVTADDRTSQVVTAVVVGVIVPVGEELGWTWFATPRLRQRHGIVATGIIMGLLWGAWHFPVFAGSTGASGDVPPTLYLVAMLFSWLIPYRVLMVWAYDRTRSLLVAIVMHTSIVVNQFVLTPESIAGEAMLVSLVAYAALLWLVVGTVTRPRGRAAS